MLFRRHLTAEFIKKMEKSVTASLFSKKNDEINSAIKKY